MFQLECVSPAVICDRKYFRSNNTEAVNRTLGPTESLGDGHPRHTHVHTHDSVQPHVHWGLALVYTLINTHTHSEKVIFSLGVWPTGLKHTTVWNITGIQFILWPGLSSFLLFAVCLCFSGGRVGGWVDLDFIQCLMAEILYSEGWSWSNKWHLWVLAFTTLLLSPSKMFFFV